MVRYPRSDLRRVVTRHGDAQLTLYRTVHGGCDLRSTYATRSSAGGVADEWVTQLLRQGDAQVFKKYSQMKLQMKREALQKLNRTANESAGVWDRPGEFWYSFGTVFALKAKRT
jgi:hypothetical protein